MRMNSAGNGKTDVTSQWVNFTKHLIMQKGTILSFTHNRRTGCPTRTVLLGLIDFLSPVVGRR